MSHNVRVRSGETDELYLTPWYLTLLRVDLASAGLRDARRADLRDDS